MWAAVTVAVFATAVSAQTPQQSAVMPGTPVGTPSVQPIGSRLPSVGTQPPRVGQPLQSGKLPASPFSCQTAALKKAVPAMPDQYGNAAGEQPGNVSR